MDKTLDKEDRKDSICIKKEMKKAKTHMVHVSQEYPRRLVMTALTPREAYIAWKGTYFVAKNREDFTNLGRDWTEFNVTEAEADPDKIIATLDEHSEKLGEFGKKYKKDALQILSKLTVAVPESYQHIFTLLNTDGEHNKGADVQLETAKRMMKAHYETSVRTESSTTDSMMCMFVGGGRKESGYLCDHCGKKGHTAYKDGKPFCHELVKALKGGTDKTFSSEGSCKSKFRFKCRKCGKPGHKKADCPDNEDSN